MPEKDYSDCYYYDIKVKVHYKGFTLNVETWEKPVM